MLVLEKLNKKGIHDVFDGDMDNSYQVKDCGDVVGYLNFQKSESGSAWVDFILAKKKGLGYGKDMINTIFELGFDKIEGMSIYGPHFFWLSIGATFYEEPGEDIHDGVLFELTKENFNNALDQDS